MKKNLSKSDDYLLDLFESKKPLIIYKAKNGFDVFTDFSEKIKLNNTNIDYFFKKLENNKNNKNTFSECYIGFFGYEILCNLIGIKIPKQKTNNFLKGIFYKPKKLIKIRKSVQIKRIVKYYKVFDDTSNNLQLGKNNTKFKVNLSLMQYTNIFNKFSRKIRKGETYQIKICQKYKKKLNINSVKFFWNLMQVNSAPESFLIRDRNYSIISCSPETLIERKKNIIKTKPIAGTMRKNKSSNFNQARKYFNNNQKETKEHNMIVDMERNDLSKICIPGSVKISKLKYIEEYKDLFHCVSEISGKLDPKKSIKDIIQSMMPGGSVIGCPKINTLNFLIIF